MQGQGFYVRRVPPEVMEQLGEEADRNRRDVRDEAVVLISEALRARRAQAERMQDRRPIAAA
jgi:hypothetical protein